MKKFRLGKDPEGQASAVMESQMETVEANVAPVDGAKTNGAIVDRLIEIADLARDSRNWEAAVSGYSKVLETDSGLAPIWVQYGHALKESGDYQEAKNAYRKSFEISSAEADTLVQLGHVTKLMGSLSEAAYYYAQALILDPQDKIAQRELATLRQKGVMAKASGYLPIQKARQQPLRRRTSSTGAGYIDEISRFPSVASQASSGLHFVFDVSDLLQYFRNARLPTGIQRVQIEIISAAYERLNPNADFRLCFFSDRCDGWVEVPWEVMSQLCSLSVVSGNAQEPEWINALVLLDELSASSEPFVFPRGAILLNLGTSWWLQNYFLQVRMAKQRYGIKYVPFVHDLIPIMTPEHCIRNLTQDFISWVMGVFKHADYFLVNSEATKRDLVSVANTLGHAVDKVSVVRLDGNFCQDATKVDIRALEKFGIHDHPFVLFVGTIESRKNHIAAFDAWLKLIKKRGINNVPKLVCVGNSGWLNEAALSKLRASDLLQQKVIMLSKVSDAELMALYQSCLFTFYPSLYEGWGLPITESLCFGKLPLVSQVSSMPEAGSEFAEYFDLGSEADLLAKLERLFDDSVYRSQREDRIRTTFFPRDWSEISDELISKLIDWEKTTDEASPPPEADANLGAAFPVELGRYYPLTRNNFTTIWQGMSAGELYRSGGWWWPEDWGCWTKPGIAQITFRAPPGEDLRIYFGLHGLQQKHCNFSLSSNLSMPVTGLLQQNELRWVSLHIKTPANMTAPVRITVASDQSEDFAKYTQGVDKRQVSIGVKGFMICEKSDIASRCDFLEAIVLKDFENLAKPAELAL